MSLLRQSSVRASCAASSDSPTKYHSGVNLYLLIWNALCLILLAILPSWKLGLPIWRLPPEQLRYFLVYVAAFLFASSVAFVLRPDTWPRLLIATSATAAVFSVVFLGFIITRTEFSRTVTIASFASALVLIPAPYLIWASRSLRLAGLAALLAMIAVAPFAVKAAVRSLAYTTKLLGTEYYVLNVESYPSAFPKSAVVGGALARFHHGYLILAGDGRLSLFNWDQSTGELKVIPTDYRVPINGEAFAKSVGQSSVVTALEGGEAATLHEDVNSALFRTYGLLVQEEKSIARIFASHPYWYADRRCWVERISVLEVDTDSFLTGAKYQSWKTLYETQPCLPIDGEQRRHGLPFGGYFGGGRMALLDAHTLLLTVGDFGFDGLASTKIHAQDPSTSYGKTIAIDLGNGQSTLFTMGHRNPQGLFIDHSGNIWSTEHGPRGGDELNRLERNKNYGWPYVTYGTDYGMTSWPLNRPEAKQLDYEAPLFAWVPSIGVSNLLMVGQETFENWRGDLLVGSLRAETLFRLRLRDSRVVYAEPILIGRRIRDLVEGSDGRIVILTDDASLISLRPAAGTSGEGLFVEKCNGCHQSKRVSGNRIGPNLAGVVGRRVASLESYPDYSAALRHLGGVWSSDRLDVFLQAPHKMVPGTTMDVVGNVSDLDRKAIIRYLATTDAR